jgi:hypothetical protein
LREKCLLEQLRLGHREPCDRPFGTQRIDGVEASSQPA